LQYAVSWSKKKKKKCETVAFQQYAAELQGDAVQFSVQEIYNRSNGSLLSQ